MCPKKIQVSKALLTTYLIYVNIPPLKHLKALAEVYFRENISCLMKNGMLLKREKN